MNNRITNFLTFIFFALLSTIGVGSMIVFEGPTNMVSEKVTHLGVAYAVGTGSMMPLIHGQDKLTFSIDDRHFMNGDIIIFTSCDGGWVVHRIYSTLEIQGKRYYITKGDVNEVIDNCLITDEMVKGKVIRIERGE